MDTEKIISLKNVCMYFGGIKAIDDVTFDIDKGRLFGIIGPNGAGKTTIFNVITGMYIPTSGEIYYRDQQLNRLMPHTITGNGIARTFQNIRLFEDQTVLDNLKIANFSHTKYGLLDVFLQSRKFKQEEERIEETSMEILKFLKLERLANKRAGSLPYGEQRRVEIARALSCNPEVLLLDEPAAGMNPAEIRDLNQLILNIRDHYDLTIMVVEHQMRLVMEICEEILVLNFGKKLAIGQPEQLKTNPVVLEAYLGKTS
ncbi:MAG TPA: high-affinity branched-chain amino acid ABC transporter ATP-binding protein LivG [Anaerolineaceae bacterium]|nr:high-affinity branched-chain amino acid ABC transporter ATP-binding protein LivG [Anaerolineaceae bacterium]